jgi:uncharacterized membrane protein
LTTVGDSRVHGALRGLHLLLLVVWLGGAVTLFAAVAPAAFTHLPNTKLSGLIVGHVIGFLDWLALCAWPYFAVTAWLDERARGNPTSQWVRVGALTVIAVVALLSRAIIVPRMDALRLASDYTGVPGAAWSGKAEFGVLHGLSSSSMLLAVLCGLAALWFAARRRPGADALEAERLRV